MRICHFETGRCTVWRRGPRKCTIAEKLLDSSCASVIIHSFLPAENEPAFGDNVLTIRNITVLLPLLALSLGCSGAPVKTSAVAPKPKNSVQVIEVQAQEFPQTIKVQGSLLGDEHAVVGVKVAGSVKKVDVDLGTRVKRDDVLAALDLRDFEVKIKQAQAEEATIRARLGLNGQDVKKFDRTKAPSVVQEKALLDGAQAAYDRAAALERRRAIAADEMQVYSTNLKVAETKYQSALHFIDEQLALLDMHTNSRLLAEQALRDATIKAPFDGVVAHRHVAPGVYLQVGDPVVTLIRTDPLRFQAGVPERHSHLVQVGEEVLITIEGQTAPLIGKVTRVSPVLNLASRSLPIEADISNPDSRLRAGLFAEAEIVVNPKAQSMVVPTSALIEFAGVEKVCVIEGQKAVMRRVTIGRRLGDRIEILDGLRANERVVLDGRSAPRGAVASVSIVPFGTKPQAPAALETN